MILGQIGIASVEQWTEWAKGLLSERFRDSHGTVPGAISFQCSIKTSASSLDDAPMRTMSAVVALEPIVKDQQKTIINRDCTQQMGLKTRTYTIQWMIKR